MKIHLSNSANRDATIVASSKPAREKTIPAKGGAPVTFQRYVAAGENRLNDALLEQFGGNYAQALIESDPEIDLEMVGRTIDGTQSILLDKESKPLFCAPEIFEIIYSPDGKESERRTPVDASPNISGDIPIKWTGRLVSRADLVRKYGIKRTLQLHHVDGVTFDFLFGIAKELDEKKSVMLLAAGESGKDPLILQMNGSPYRGFLDGRVSGEKFILLLHLSAMELKKPAAKASKEGE